MLRENKTSNKINSSIRFNRIVHEIRSTIWCEWWTSFSLNSLFISCVSVCVCVNCILRANILTHHHVRAPQHSFMKIKLMASHLYNFVYHNILLSFFFTISGAHLVSNSSEWNTLKRLNYSLFQTIRVSCSPEFVTHRKYAIFVFFSLRVFNPLRLWCNREVSVWVGRAEKKGHIPWHEI